MFRVFIVDIWTDLTLIAGRSSRFSMVHPLGVFSYAFSCSVGGALTGRGSLSHREGKKEESLKERGKERDMDQIRKEREAELGVIC